MYNTKENKHFKALVKNVLWVQSMDFFNMFLWYGEVWDGKKVLEMRYMGAFFHLWRRPKASDKYQWDTTDVKLIPMYIVWVHY